MYDKALLPCSLSVQTGDESDAKRASPEVHEVLVLMMENGQGISPDREDDVEVRGVEPLSEDSSAKLSPSAFRVQFPGLNGHGQSFMPVVSSIRTQLQSLS